MIGFLLSALLAVFSLIPVDAQGEAVVAAGVCRQNGEQVCTIATNGTIKVLTADDSVKVNTLLSPGGTMVAFGRLDDQRNQTVSLVATSDGNELEFLCPEGTSCQFNRWLSDEQLYVVHWLPGGGDGYERLGSFIYHTNGVIEEVFSRPSSPYEDRDISPYGDVRVENGEIFFRNVSISTTEISVVGDPVWLEDGTALFLSTTNYIVDNAWMRLAQVTPEGVFPWGETLWRALYPR